MKMKEAFKIDQQYSLPSKATLDSPLFTLQVKTLN
jgi:hypothetical protein